MAGPRQWLFRYIQAGILIVILLTPLLSAKTVLGGHLQAINLAKEGDESSVVGSPVYVVFSFTYSGTTVNVYVYVPRGDAYIAVAAVLWGLYDHNAD
jgi:hypothetical protein